MFNSNNRSHAVLSVGAVAATKEVGFIHAQKKMIVRNLSMIDITLVGAHADNYVEVIPLVDGAEVVGSKADTKLGLDAREPLECTMVDIDTSKTKGIELEKGEVLSVSLTVAGTGALTNASLHADIEIVGN